MENLIRYVNPKGPLPATAGTKSGPLLIMGTAACLWEDLAKYDHLHDGERMAVNDAMAYYRNFSSHRLDHGAALHSDWLSVWAAAANMRCKELGEPGICTHSQIKYLDLPEIVWPLHRDGGTAGLFAVLIGLLMGFDRIVLAGSPIDGSRHFFESELNAVRFYSADTYRDEWLRARDAVFNGRVKSLSGRTREWLGEPQ